MNPTEENDKNVRNAAKACLAVHVYGICNSEDEILKFIDNISNIPRDASVSHISLIVPGKILKEDFTKYTKLIKQQANEFFWRFEAIYDESQFEKIEDFRYLCFKTITPYFICFESPFDINPDLFHEFTKQCYYYYTGNGQFSFLPTWFSLDGKSHIRNVVAAYNKYISPTSKRIETATI